MSDPSLSPSQKQNKHSTHHNDDVIHINRTSTILDHCQWRRPTPHGTSKIFQLLWLTCFVSWLAFSLFVTRREPWSIHTRPEFFFDNFAWHDLQNGRNRYWAMWSLVMHINVCDLTWFGIKMVLACFESFVSLFLLYK